MRVWWEKGVAWVAKSEQKIKGFDKHAECDKHTEDSGQDLQCGSRKHSSANQRSLKRA